MGQRRPRVGRAGRLSLRYVCKTSAAASLGPRASCPPCARSTQGKAGHVAPARQGPVGWRSSFGAAHGRAGGLAARVRRVAEQPQSAAVFPALCLAVHLVRWGLEIASYFSGVARVACCRFTGGERAWPQTLRKGRIGRETGGGRGTGRA